LDPSTNFPPEGADLEPSTESEVDFCASMFAESNITFDVSRDGVMVTSNPQNSDLFQEFEIDLKAGEEEPYLIWKDDAFDIHLQGLFRDRGAFSTLSDASDPEDYVRRFLEVLASSLDEPSMELEGKKVPLIRWQAGEDGESAEVQLLGLLLADDEQFEAFCKEREGEIGFILEDAEVQAHGIRETLTMMVILGVTLGSTTNADAGPFNFKKKKQAKEMARQQAIMEQQAIQKRQAAIQQAQRTGYLDMHNDAYVNHQLLEAGKDRREKGHRRYFPTAGFPSDQQPNCNRYRCLDGARGQTHSTWSIQNHRAYCPGQEINHLRMRYALLAASRQQCNRNACRRPPRPCLPQQGASDFPTA
jgi:hypothetical protein